MKALRLLFMGPSLVAGAPILSNGLALKGGGINWQDPEGAARRELAEEIRLVAPARIPAGVNSASDTPDRHPRAAASMRR